MKKWDFILMVGNCIPMNKPILIKQFANRWYLYWADSGQTIASFASEFEAYAARRSVLKYVKKGGIS